jgi:hypothetical protein
MTRRSQNVGGTIKALDGLVTEMRSALSGVVLTAGDPEYDQARKVWNGMFDDRRPLAILRCADEADVSRAVSRLGDVDAPLAIRGGGHHIAGFGGCDGGFVIDLTRLRSTTVRPGERVIRVEGGGLLHDIDTAGAEHGLAVPVGVVSLTGVAGLTLSGGVGWQTRRRGYACDSLRRCRVVTASGEIVEADEDQNSDLLWGLRGGGGNFGVVTEFEFDAYPVDEVLVTIAYYRIRDAEEIATLLRSYRDWADESNEDQTAWVTIGTAGESLRGLVPDLVGGIYLAISACSLQPADADRAHLDRLGALVDPVFAETAAMRMVELQHLGDADDSAVPGMPRYMKGEMMRELTDEMIEGIASACAEMPTTRTIYEMGMQGGALGRVDEMAMAAGMRDARYLGGFSVMGDEPGEDIGAGVEWARQAWHALEPGSCGGTYLNFDGEADGGRVLGSLSAGGTTQKRDRLAKVKQAWDPGNRFRINHNISPAA